MCCAASQGDGGKFSALETAASKREQETARSSNVWNWLGEPLGSLLKPCVGVAVGGNVLPNISRG